MAAPEASGYPLRFDVEYPENLSRFLIFIKWILALPHLLVLYIVGLIAGLMLFISWFAILFTGRFPRGMFDFITNYLRWSANVNAYIYLLRDEYPPFSGEPGKFPLTLEVDYPENLSRFLIFVKWILAIPHFIALVIIGLIAYIMLIIAWFSILFTGTFPRGMFDFIVGTFRWSTRVTAYLYLMRDEYPPFSMKP